MTRLSRRAVAAYLKEIGIDYVPRVRRSRRGAGGPAVAPGSLDAPPEVAEASASAPPPPAGETLDAIREELAKRRCCPLCRSGTRLVFGVGNPRARLMFVGEGPGEEEDRQGEPFVGAAGRRLNQWIARMGLRREDVYIANIVKCRPPGNRAPLPEEALACLPYLKRQIRVVRPEVIVTLGAVALNFLLDTTDKITRARGKWRAIDRIPVLPTYHPAYILRNAGRESEVFEDLALIAERLGLPRP